MVIVFVKEEVDEGRSRARKELVGSCLVALNKKLISVLGTILRRSLSSKPWVWKLTERFRSSHQTSARFHLFELRTTIVDDEGVEQLDEFIAFPKSFKLMIGFNRVLRRER